MSFFQKGFFDGSFLRRLRSNEDENLSAEVAKKDKALLLIQSWAKSFPHGRYPSFNKVYQNMIHEAVSFPLPKDEAPLLSPKKRSLASQPGPATSAAPAVGAASASAASIHPLYAVAAPPVLDELVRNTATLSDVVCVGHRELALLLFEMTNASDAAEPLTRNELCAEIAVQLRRASGAMVARMSGQSPPPEALLFELVATNDLVDQMLAFYDGVTTHVLLKFKTFMFFPFNDISGSFISTCSFLLRCV